MASKLYTVRCRPNRYEDLSLGTDQERGALWGPLVPDGAAQGFPSNFLVAYTHDPFTIDTCVSAVRDAAMLLVAVRRGTDGAWHIDGVEREKAVYGRLGGLSRSKRKQASSRRNGLLGGRPVLKA